VSGTVTYAAAAKKATLNPSDDLLLATSYTATVTTGVTDQAGNAMAADEVWSFTTSATLPPPPPPPPPPTIGIARETTATTVNATATNSLSIATPFGTSVGDVLVSCLALNGSSVASPPPGWTPIASVTSIANPHVFGYYRVADTFEPDSYTWTLATSVANGGGIARYSGVDNSVPLDVTARTAAGASATSGTVPGVTTATANAMLIGCLAINSSNTGITIASPSGMAEGWDIGGKRHELADGLQATPGGSGDQTWTFSSAREWAGWLAALRPQ
jgi:hypothetical protein